VIWLDNPRPQNLVGRLSVFQEVRRSRPVGISADASPRSFEAGKKEIVGSTQIPMFREQNDPASGSRAAA
jgi:hypothetical protein